MRDDVTIVLNEREPRKASLAADLVARLANRGITAFRVAPSAELVEILTLRRPLLVVTDYLLEEYGTGIDLLAALRTSAHNSPEVIFLSDDPSVSVAVESMREGALHYISLERSDALDHVTREVERIVKHRALCKAPKALPGLSELAFVSTRGRRLEEEVLCLQKERPALLAVHGPRGSGRHTVARIIAKAWAPSGLHREVDLSITTSPIAQILTEAQALAEQSIPLLLSSVEEEIDALLAFLTGEGATRLTLPNWILLLESEEALTRLKSALSPRILRVPSLVERRDDIRVIAQQTLVQAGKLLGRKPPELDAGALEWLERAALPGEIRELEAIVTHAALHSLLHAQPLKDALARTAAEWEREWLQPPRSVRLPASLVAQAYRAHDRDARRTALALGISFSDLCASLLEPL